jgi:phosphatidyl-myo-inositol alpha-mannosyltransferase
MKVAITHPYSWPEVRRGAERITVETGRALAARGHDVTLFTAGRAASEDGTCPGMRVVRYRRLFDDPHRHERWFAWRAFPDLVRGRFDAVHSLMPHDAIAAIRARRLTGHVTVYEEMGNPYRWWWDGLPDRRARRRVVREVDVYACMSRYSLRVLETEWKRGGVVVPGGVRLDEFEPADRAPTPTILFSGALTEPRKHLDTLLDAVALLAPHEPDLRLWLSGPGDPAPFLAAAPPEARARTEVLGLGDANEQGSRYASAWVTALPSEADSFGMVAVESLACGTPIVVADDGAPQELVSNETGSVTQLRDPESLAAGLSTAFDLAQRSDTAVRCRERARSFDWELAIAPFLEKLYTGTITGELFGGGSRRAA